MSEKPKLTVLEGGLSSKKIQVEPELNDFNKFSEFRYAEATRSRLMGVVGLHIVYAEKSEQSFPASEYVKTDKENQLDADNQEEALLHHYLYLDYEEYGIDNYEILMTRDSSQAERKKINLFGGLGEPWVSLSEKESLYLVEDSYEFTLQRGLFVPDSFDQPGAIKFAKLNSTLEEVYGTYSKICTHISSEYELINYFIMRLAGCDLFMAKQLCETCVDFNDFPISVPSALCSNTIDIDENTENGYICESLIDDDDEYYLVISKVSTGRNKSNPKIASYQLVSCNKVSGKEASMIMNKEHFIVVNLLSGNTDEDRKSVKDWLRIRFDTMTLSEYENTSIIMVFNSNNAHVNQKRYRIDNDLLGMMFYTKAGELVIDAISPVKAAVIAQSLVESPVPLESAGAIKLNEAVMLPFIDSEFDSFIDYLQTLQK